MKKILFVLGTRPEAIKLAPVIIEFKKENEFLTKVCITAQHREMLDQVLDFFNIKPDYDLNLMKSDQSLLRLMSDAIVQLEAVINDFTPDVIIVQGDTTTVLAGALVGFHKRIKVAHIEAGLRSYDKFSPFPEEMNRLLTTRLADFHFAPTQKAVENLLHEGAFENVFLVGNTVIDALKIGIHEVEKNELSYFEYFNQIDFRRKVLLVTCHRREIFGEPFEQICQALLRIADQHPDIQIVYPVHLNPNIKEVAEERLVRENIKLISPLDYPHLIWLMNKTYIILTDSGGIQEEAPFLGKPVLILRDVTERTEGVTSGTAILVGTNKRAIVNWTDKLIQDRQAYDKMSRAVNPYGDGFSSTRIVNHLKQILCG